ncbi:hypothetical protein ACNOYE_09590 [Nannocystaceae bacterium ST9]
MPMLSFMLVALLGPPELPLEAKGEPVPLTLDWRADPGCPSRDEVAGMLVAFLPDHPAIPASEGAPGRLAATARVASQGSAWRVELELAGERGVERRSFAAETCAIAAEATVLVIAVAIDPIAALEHTTRPSEPASSEPNQEPAPEPESEPDSMIESVIEPMIEPGVESDESIRVHLDSPAASEPARSGRARGGLALRGGGGFGPLRAGSGLVELRVAAFGRAWRWEARAAWLPPVQIDLGEGQRGRFDGWLLGTRGCGVPSRGKLEFPICAGIEAGQLRGEGRSSVPNPVRVTQPWLAIELGPALAWAPRPNVALGLELDALIPLIAAGFSIDGQPVVRTTPVGVRALAGLEVRFP